MSGFKLFSDPVHGFVSVPKGLLMELVQTPEVQRLRRIRQLGTGHLVFPGAEHTRFGHALGAMALMQDALSSLSEKGTPISQEEHTAALAAALLHDVGHGPYSHTLEDHLIRDFHHEKMSRAFLAGLNERFGDALDLALRIFDDAYERPFFHQLVASQLDMDRLDYLRRDSFYTGVAEGKVGVERLIKTLRVTPAQGGPDARVVIEAKGIYAVENFLISRRLMFWQVYLHKTVLAGDHILQAAFRRARTHLRDSPDTSGLGGEGSPVLRFFLQHEIDASMLERGNVIEAFCALDDTDVLFSLKRWMKADDPVLADLARRFINRDFFRVSFLPEPPSDEQLADWHAQVADWLLAEGLSTPSRAEADADYYFALSRSRHAAYERTHAAIGVLDRRGRVRELSEMADTAAAVTELTQAVDKPYVCYPKAVPVIVGGG